LALSPTVALLDAGLPPWRCISDGFILPALAAAGTVIMQVGWAAGFFRTRTILPRQQGPDPDDDTSPFQRTLAGSHKLSRRLKEDDWFFSLSALRL